MGLTTSGRWLIPGALSFLALSVGFAVVLVVYPFGDRPPRPAGRRPDPDHRRAVPDGTGAAEQQPCDGGDGQQWILGP